MKTINRFTFFLAFTFSILPQALFSNDLRSPSTNGLKEFQGKGYTISFPDNWRVMRGFMGADLVGHEPYLTDLSKPKPSVTVYVESKPQALSDLEFLDATRQSLKKAIGTSEQINFTKNNSFFKECHEANYKMVKDEYSAANRVLIFFRNNIVYTITISLPHDISYKDKIIVDSILESFYFQG
jgi:hypothetical protein